MNSFLPEQTRLGRLEMLEVYEYYDRPILFACRNATDQIFLAVLEEEQDNQEVWLYVPVSHGRFESIRHATVDLYTTFSVPEDGFLYKVTTQYGEDYVDIQNVVPDSLPSSSFPQRGQYLQINKSALAITPTTELARKARQLVREIVRLIFEFPNRRPAEAPARVIGPILEQVQSVVDALTASLSPIYRTGRQTSSLRTESDLLVIATGEGSVVVELASSMGGDLFNFTLVGESIERLVVLFNIGSDSEQLITELSELNPSVSKNYLELLKTINNAAIDYTRIEWASPQPEKGGSARLSLLAIAETVAVLENWQDREAREITVLGRLLGANVRTRNFEVLAEAANDSYKGKIAPDISLEDREFIDHARLSERYWARIREYTFTNNTTGKEVKRYQLLALYPPDTVIQLDRTIHVLT